MSARFNTSTEFLARTTDLPNGGIFFVCGWAYRVVDTAEYASLFAYEGGLSTENVIIELGPGGDNLIVFYRMGGGSGDEVTVMTLTHPAWFFWALNVNGLNATGYGLEIGDTSLTSNTAVEPGGGGAIDNRIILGNNQHTEPFNGRIANVKLWSGVNLTESQIWQEMFMSAPRRLADLHLWTPNPEDLTDFSGFGRDWTETGSVEKESEPPISWGPPTFVPPVLGAPADENVIVKFPRRALQEIF